MEYGISTPFWNTFPEDRNFCCVNKLDSGISKAHLGILEKFEKPLSPLIDDVFMNGTFISEISNNNFVFFKKLRLRHFGCGMFTNKPGQNHVNF